MLLKEEEGKTFVKINLYDLADITSPLWDEFLNLHARMEDGIDEVGLELCGCMILSKDGNWYLPKLLEELDGSLILLAEVLLVALLVEITKEEIICFDRILLVSINPKDQVDPMVQIQGHELTL